MADLPGAQAHPSHRGILKSPIDFGAGVLLLLLAAVGYVGAYDLPFGQLSGIGSGLMPKVVSVLVGIFGALILVQSFLVHGGLLERWSIRGPFFVLGAVILFALTIRTWGLAIAGPLAMLFSSIADKETRPVEIVIYSVILTAVCIGVFKFMLRLPIPILPPGYGPF